MRVLVTGISGFVGGLPRLAEMKHQFVELTHLLTEHAAPVTL